MKEILDTQLNGPDDFADLDALFSSAREDQPILVDQNFTKVVANSLPSRPVRREKRGLSFDLIGVTLGLILAYFYFDVSKMLSAAVNLIPETIVLSPVHALIAIGSVTVMSAIAWWTVENSRNL